MKAIHTTLTLLCAGIGLGLLVPGAHGQGRGNSDAVGAMMDSFNSLAQREAENTDPRQIADIVNSGSTNTLGYRITVPRSGHAIWEIGSLQVHGNLDESLVAKFYSDLRAAQPLSGLTPGAGAKSVSFGTITTIVLDGQTSPDISLAGDARGQALWADVGAVNIALGARDLPRHPMLEVPPVGPHGHLPSSALIVTHLGPQDNGRTLSLSLGRRLSIALEPAPGSDVANAAGVWSAIDVSQPRILGIVSADAAAPTVDTPASAGSTCVLLIAARPGTVVLTSHLLVNGKSTIDWKVTLKVSGARLSDLSEPKLGRRG